MFVENRAAFMVDFAEDVTLGGAAARVFFDDAYIDPLNVAGTSPAASAFKIDLPAYTVGTTLLVRNGVTYRVVNELPDGTGWVALQLERQ